MAKAKKGVKLARVDLIPPKPLWLIAEVFGRGARKYAENNWLRGGAPFSAFYGAMMRHALKWLGGEKYDPEDGQHHLASVAWMAIALMELEEVHPEDDDRPRPVKLESEKLYDSFEDPDEPLPEKPALRELMAAHKNDVVAEAGDHFEPEPGMSVDDYYSHDHDGTRTLHAHRKRDEHIVLPHQHTITSEELREAMAGDVRAMVEHEAGKPGA